MAGVERQWDTDWFDKFKTIMATNMTTLNLYPGMPLSWCGVWDIAFGQKQVEVPIRRPDQRVHVSKEIEYPQPKYAERIVQVKDMPSITDEIRISEEYYSGDPVNALGHVGDLGTNYMHGVKDVYILGSATDPTVYGLLDGGAGTGVTTVTRPDIVDAVTTGGDWSTPANMMEDLSSMEAALEGQGFHGPKMILTHPLVKPYLNNVLTSTVTPYKTWIHNIGGYPTEFGYYYDADASTDVVDIYMVDTSAFTIYQTPIRGKAFYQDETDHFVWRWQTRGALLAKPMYNGTDWKKGLVKCIVDLFD